MDFETEAKAILARGHLNVLLIGADGALAHSLAVLAPMLRQPVVTWAPAGGSCLPQGECGTLIIEAVDRANARQQASLLAWVDDRSTGTQIVSTSRSSLFPLIASGAFLETLYYRLNHVMFHVKDDAAPLDV